MTNSIKQGRKFSLPEEGSFLFKEIFNHQNSNLEFLSLSALYLNQGQSPLFSFPEEELLLFMVEGEGIAQVEKKEYFLEFYDVLYVPVGMPFRLKASPGKKALLYAYRATASKPYPIHHASWKKISSDPKRIRKLQKKNVFLMFDVAEQANKLVAGYTIYEPQTRAWPPHNHTDQEEVYSFIQGKGAMSVYPDDEHQTFVTSVYTGDNITIPLLNYHPVFSQDEPLTFIWCIAGERYWVGDKNEDFMKGKADKITT
ncbi:MAG TPA: 5-deoxy-glucuronate isomerase [Spirochaetales bacterium]|nr:5-deoxy-glucuronate isomerase [Spirochaetales bacterium]